MHQIESEHCARSEEVTAAVRDPELHDVMHNCRENMILNIAGASMTFLQEPPMCSHPHGGENRTGLLKRNT
jgi:hypothetical protein